MKVLGIYGSPRKGGNSDLLLDEALRGAADAGAEVKSVRCCDMDIGGCVECAGCDATGECVVDDDMQQVYPLLQEANVIILASPMFFYSVPAQAKALIDRCQAMWCKRLLEKPSAEKNAPARGRGFLIAIGATKGKNLFEGAELVAKYFYDALQMTYEGGLFVRSVEGKADIAKHPDELKRAYALGKDIALRESASAESK
jgi:multimeric flavodoxin WrbA